MSGFQPKPAKYDQKSVGRNPHGGIFSRKILLITLLSSTFLPMFISTASAVELTPPEPNQLPTGGQVQAGSAHIDQNGSNMTVHQNTTRAVIDWMSFDVGRDAS